MFAIWKFGDDGWLRRRKVAKVTWLRNVVDVACRVDVVRDGVVEVAVVMNLPKVPKTQIED